MSELKTTKAVVELVMQTGIVSQYHSTPRTKCLVNIDGKMVEVFTGTEVQTGDIVLMEFRPKGHTFENKDGESVTTTRDKWSLKGSYGKASNLEAVVASRKAITAFDSIMSLASEASSVEANESFQEEPADVSQAGA